MPCTTILVGKKASFDGSTLVARNEDCPQGQYNPKRLALVKKEEVKAHYQAVLSQLDIKIDRDPMTYSYTPNSDLREGIWGCYGVNEKNVSMTATETITSNERVLSADPLLKAENEGEKPQGLGEEDMVSLCLPYIQSARDGVLWLGQLLEEHGTYEMNGIAFQDQEEIWWLETLGGHHWMAKRVPDEAYVIMPNQLGIDSFDFQDAYGKKEGHLCSKDLKDFVEKNHLDLRMDREEIFNPRWAFGSHTDADHSYNTPRAWVLLRYFNPKTYSWDGERADFGPEDDDLPWSLVPERKITVEDIKWALSNHYQGTPYDPYQRTGDPSSKKKYRPIGINRTNVLGLVQIRPDLPEEIKSLHWLAFASNVFNALVPFYTCVEDFPAYVNKPVLKPSTDSFYWVNRLIGALADPHIKDCQIDIDRYQDKVHGRTLEIIKRTDAAILAGGSCKELATRANQEIADFVEEESLKLLDQVLFKASNAMTNSFSRSDA